MSSTKFVEVPKGKASGHRIPFFPSKILLSGVTLLFGFWFVAIWIFGSTYQQQSKAANLKVLVADSDGDTIGKTLLTRWITHCSNS